MQTWGAGGVLLGSFEDERSFATILGGRTEKICAHRLQSTLLAAADGLDLLGEEELGGGIAVARRQVKLGHLKSR